MGACVSSSDGAAAPAYVFNLNAEPTAAETEIWTSSGDAIAKGTSHLRNMTEYKGCDQVIRAALSDPNPTTEAAAWKAVEKSVDHLYNFFNYARELEGLLPGLLTAICLNPDAPVSQNSALVKLLGKVFHFAFHFDELKMGNPAISNDFSYYRRVLSRMRNAGSDDKKKKKTQVTEEIANLMSFHYAYPTPVMKVLIAAAVQMPTAASLVPGLAEIANVACSMAQNPDEDQKLLLCLMTGCIILIDHLAGVFHKKSPVRIRQCVMLLRNTAGTDSLMNSLRFSTLHLNDDTTPPNISKLFE